MIEEFFLDPPQGVDLPAIRFHLVCIGSPFVSCRTVFGGQIIAVVEKVVVVSVTFSERDPTGSLKGQGNAVKKGPVF